MVFGSSIRQPAVAGSFYPSDKEDLKCMVNRFINEAEEKKLAGNIKGLIEPHAGYIYSGSTASYGYKLLKNLDKSINWKVFLLGPSHQLNFTGVATIAVDYWETPQKKVRQSKLVNALVKNHPDIMKIIPEAHLTEHCLEVQLPFLIEVLKSFEIVPILTGDVSPQILAEVLIKYSKLESLFIVSSDLSHYYPYEQAKRIDLLANEAIPALKLKKTKQEVEACGKIAILTLMHIARLLNWKGTLLSYRNSGDTAGDKFQVVGYGCFAFSEEIRNTNIEIRNKL